ncbi:MAG: putative glycoside hydrolase [Candidatus Bipolaricaulota bacterium]
MNKTTKLVIGTFILVAIIFLGSGEIDQRTFVNITVPGSGETRGEVGGIKGVYLNSRAVTKTNTKDWIRKLKSHGFNSVVIDVKNVSGEITYNSEVNLAKELGSASGRLDLREIVSEFQTEGIYVIARLTCFKDRIMANRCCGGGEWVYPSNKQAQQYNIELAREAAELGFDEVQLDYIRYSDEQGNIGGDYRERSKVIANFVQQVKESIPSHVKLSLDVYGRTMWKWNSKNIDPIGQNLDYLEKHADFMSPMIYPSHYQDPDLVYNPDKLVELVMGIGRERLTVPLRPFIQGFDRAMPSGVDLVNYISLELETLERLGVEDYLVWNPKSNYDSLWRALEHIPQV